MFTLNENPIGRILAGDKVSISSAIAKWRLQPVDDLRTIDGDGSPYPEYRSTIGKTVSVHGVGTFCGSKQRTLTFCPTSRRGWWIKRSDQYEQLPIAVSPGNVWTAQRNIVLRAGSAHNYLRMVEHIIALRAGLAVDDLLIVTDNGDPPLFDRSSLDLTEAVEAAGIVPGAAHENASFVTVREPVTIGGERGDFVTLLPAEKNQRKLRLDVAIDWTSVIGQQRIVFDLTRDNFVHGAGARTNATNSQMVFQKIFGIFFADMRHLGYTKQNILIHGKRRYINEPLRAFDLNGRSFEPVWHRATLDLLAAISLLDGGRFVGTVISYRAGHALDARLATLVTLKDLLVSL